MQQWTAAETLTWLLDDTSFATLPIVAAFVSGALDGRTLTALVGPNDVLASRILDDMNIPAASVQTLLEHVERYVFPSGLDQPPALESCSRLPKPLAVRQAIDITDIYVVDDVGMEFEIAFTIETQWDDDRVLYIPESTESELELCTKLCFNPSVTVVDGPTPLEASRCCDKMWIPIVAYTNSKELIPSQEPQVFWYDKTATMRASYRGIFKTTMFFDNFPFDRQNLVIDMQLPYKADDVTFQVSSLATTSQDSPGWTISPRTETTVGWTVSTKHEGGIDYSVATARFQVTRMHSHFVDNYMSSMVMRCTLSWLAFTLKSTYIEARLSLTITLILAMMALSQVITPSLPQTGEQTPAHKYMFRTNLFIVLVGIESVLVNALGSDYHLDERDESGEPAEEIAEENAGGNAGRMRLRLASTASCRTFLTLNFDASLASASLEILFTCSSSG